MRLRSSLLYTCALLGLSAGGAYAQAGQSATPSSAGDQAAVSANGVVAKDPASGAVQEVVVTGSLIRGTPRGGAVPVDVITSDELQKQGSPTALELIKNLPVSNGVLGDTNQFDARAQGSEGSGSVNLRGLGSQRTLVLLNGRRLAINPFGAGGAGIVDTNMLPVAAIDRVEVLKDGAAATYGSDAIAGVVNFITRRGFDGLDVGGSYKYVSGSDGDYDAHVTGGFKGDRFDVLLSAAYQHRSKLPVFERDFANRPYLENPEGGWSGAGNPGPFVNVAAGALQRDPQCAVLGSYPANSGASPLCYLHYINYDNLVEKEDRVQLFGQLNVELNEHHHFHGEALVGHTDVPEWNTSPSYAVLTGPTADALVGLTGTAATVGAATVAAGRYYVPAANPGLINFVAQNPSFAGLLGAGAQLVPPTFRPYGVGGNPAFGNGPSIGSRSYTFYRVSGGFNGDLPFYGLSYDINMGYSEEEGIRTGYDTLVDRLQLALDGFGGPSCNRAANTPGQNGCLYYNPFSNAIAVNTITGQTNPQFNAGVANSADVTRWFFQKLSTKQTATLFTVEGAVSGKIPITLPGGDIKFAVGSQFRRNGFISTYNDISNAQITPCKNTPDFGITNCTGSARNGAFVFLGPGTPADLSNNIYAFFGELQLPVTDTLQAQLAGRFEDYGGQTGSTFNPKLSVRWQVTPMFAFRGSVGTTFRGPPVTQLTTNAVTSLQSIGGTFRAVDITGNPALQPESAFTFSVGSIFKLGGFNATLDYWSIDISDGIVAEPVAGIVANVFGSGSTANCASPLVGRFTFNGASCASGPTPTLSQVGRLSTSYINGPSVKTDGLDLLADWRLPYDVFGGRVTVGTSASYVLDYSVGATIVGGVNVSPAFEAVGFLNYQTVAVPIPQWKAEVYAEYRRGPHNLRGTLHHIDSYTDQRTANFAVGAFRDTAGNPVTVSAGKKIDSFTTFDLDYRLLLPYNATFTLGIDNLFDTDPPFARLDLSYDPFTGNPLGRQIKVSLSKRF